jgi:hypothetical protein
MRAWWSMLFVPKNETNLRMRYDCSLLCLELPIQNTASGPRSLLFLIASSLSPTSLIAWSHDMRCHLPLTSFIGVLSRCECSTMPCSRTDAPFAQCAPRLSGDSNTGSWRVHTPFSTVASMLHPTEQCVHTVRFFSTLTPSFCACAGAMAPYGSWLANAPAPAAIPERLRNVRRSIVDNEAPASLRRRGPAIGVASDLRVSSMANS